MNTTLLILFLVLLLLITIRTSDNREGFISIDEISEKTRKLKDANSKALDDVTKDLNNISTNYNKLLKKIRSGAKVMGAEATMNGLSSFESPPPSKIVKSDSQFNDRCPSKNGTLSWSGIKGSVNDSISLTTSKIHNVGKDIQTTLQNKNF